MTRPPDQTTHTPASSGGGVVPVWTPDDFMALWEAVNKVDPADRAVVIDIHTRERST